MIPFKFSLPPTPVFTVLIAVLWILYIGIYWRAMVLILGASKFTSIDKILWFLVITLAPLIGIITFHVMCPPPLRNPPPES
jgi:hypothetical protein